MESVNKDTVPLQMKWSENEYAFEVTMAGSTNTVFLKCFDRATVKELQEIALRIAKERLAKNPPVVKKKKWFFGLF